METRPELPDTSEPSSSTRSPAESRTYALTSGPLPGAVSDGKARVNYLGLQCISGRSLLVALLVALIVVLVLYLAVASPKGKHLKLAHDLAACGWVLYIRPGCRFCDLQMKILGTEDYPKLVRCDPTKMRNGCKSLQGFPCWINEYSHKTRVGLLNRTQLEQMRGCY